MTLFFFAGKKRKIQIEIGPQPSTLAKQKNRQREWDVELRKREEKLKKEEARLKEEEERLRREKERFLR